MARDGVRLLARLEATGVRILACPEYLREWISRERDYVWSLAAAPVVQIEFPDGGAMFSRLLVPLDGSSLAEVLPHVSELAKTLDAELLQFRAALAHVLPRADP